MGVWAEATADALTANGTSLGVATVASNLKYKVGATVWITANAVPTKECVVVALGGSTLITLREKVFPFAGTRAGERIGYGLANLSAFTTAANARIFQEAGIAPNPL